ncbi:Ig-like domain-containing protein [Bacillus sp. EAC]|uniref:Ig-like domain-containing protein n=1 Tax=Bacillus sp. EAC TaxID=1978338 RepID=UPI000B4347EC|nr:Ig-like domain-containing protein [Bacillus sp. EAC]
MNNWKKVLVSSVIATSFVTYTVGYAHAEESLSSKNLNSKHIVTKKTKVPASPVVYVNRTINKLNAKKVEIKGKAEPKTKVVGTLKSKDSQITFTTKVDSKGNYRATVNSLKLKDGALTLSIYTIDASGSKGKVKNVSIKKDTILDELTIENEGYINSFNSSDFPVSGTGEPGATVYITAQSGKQIVTRKTIVDEFGNYSLNSNLNKFAEGKVSISAKQVDKAGNSSKVSTNLIKETKASVSPILFPAANVTADTDQTTYTISGLGKAGSEIEVVLSDGNVEVSSIGEVDSKGYFEVELDTSDLESGEISVVAIQTSAAGNPSREITTKFVKDITAPSAPEVNALGSINQDNLANYTVSGKGEIGSNVSILFTDGKSTASNYVKVNADGTYTTTLDLTQLQAGSLFVVVTQIDKAHNVSEPITLTIQKLN